jgi:hypothetical protein
MPTSVIRTGLAIAASAGAFFAAGVPAAAASGGGESNVCSAAGLPSTTQTIGIQNVYHVTVFTCGDATATGFQQCPKQTVAIPDVVHATVYYCVPVQIGVAARPAGGTFSLAGIGGVSFGPGPG